MRGRVRWTVTSLVAIAALTRAARTWFPVRVEGTSMSPTLAPGELLAARPLRPGEPHLGDIVIARMGGREVVKRVGRPPRDGAVWLVGDNAESSTDSRTSGPVPVEQLVGLVRFRYRPLRRVGRVG